MFIYNDADIMPFPVLIAFAHYMLAPKGFSPGRILCFHFSVIKSDGPLDLKL